MIDPDDIKPDTLVQHRKTGDLYEVICIAEHTETQERMVVYRGIELRWVRPLADFCGGRFELVR